MPHRRVVDVTIHSVTCDAFRVDRADASHLVYQIAAHAATRRTKVIVCDNTFYGVRSIIARGTRPRMPILDSSICRSFHLFTRAYLLVSRETSLPFAKIEQF